DYPEISLTRIDATGVQFKAIITLMPEVKLGKYKGIKIEKNKVEVTEAEVKKSLKEKAESQARFVSITDRPVKKGDLINLDYSGSVDSVKFSGGTAKNQELEIGSNTFIPGFEESLIGAELLKDIDVKVKFPEDYHAMDLAGKDAIFACKVLEIREKQVPKIDDVFASEVSEFSTLEELKKSITEKTLKTKSENANRDAENKLIETIVKNAEIDIPESMIERQIDALVDDISEKLSAQGLKFDDYLKYIGSDNDAYRKTQRKQADAMVRTSLVFEAIVSTEKIEVLKEDFDAKIAEMAKTMEKSVTEIKKEMKGKQKDVIENNILSEKVINFVKENNTIK
ncbi:MAG: trigger factor, partial [Clostridia bacterium]